MESKAQTRDVDIKRGLKGVYLDTTEASFIDGQQGKLLYRGYNIHDLAENSTFEEVIYLLLYGKLPTRRELDELEETLCANRTLPPEVIQIIRAVRDSHPMDVLRTGVSALSAFDPDVNDNSVQATIRKGIRLTAQSPTIVAAHLRIRQGLEPVEPRRDLNLAGNFLHMLFAREPDPDEARIMDVDFVLHAEHSSNASAFAARVTSSTLADLHSAVVTGIATLKGPLHGGAAENVMRMAEEIGSPENAEAYVQRVLDSGGKVAGFGHPVYKAEDPRARNLKERSRILGNKKGDPHWFRILSQLEKVMAPYQAKGVYANVDFFAGSIYYLLGIPEDLFIPIFVLGRIPGWTLQCVEQYQNNVIIRPLLEYVGPMDLDYVPIDQRS